MKLKVEKHDDTDFNKLVDKLDFETMAEALRMLSEEHRGWYKNSIPKKVLLEIVAVFVAETTGEEIKHSLVQHNSEKITRKVLYGTNAEKLANLLVDLEQLKIVHHAIPGSPSGWDKPIPYFEFVS